MRVSICEHIGRISGNLSIDIELQFEDLKVFEFPKNCASCPIGFSATNKCGRNTPFLPEDYITRPKTCKLQLIDEKEFIELCKKELEGRLNGNTVSVATEI